MSLSRTQTFLEIKFHSCNFWWIESCKEKEKKERRVLKVEKVELPTLKKVEHRGGLREEKRTEERENRREGETGSRTRERGITGYIERIVTLNKDWQKILRLKRFYVYVAEMRIIKSLRLGMFIQSRNVMTSELRRSLYAQCLNREFNLLLPRLRQIPSEDMDYTLIQLVLRQSCKWGHMGCINFIWYKYVRRNNSMLIEPNILCEMGQVALGEGKSFMVRDIYTYYTHYYGKLWRRINPREFTYWEYELIRIKTETFAKTTINKDFSEKWKVFLKDMDNYLPTYCKFSFRDFPELINSYHEHYYQNNKDHNINKRNNNHSNSNSNEILMSEYLFQDKDIIVKNETTLPLLLNIILLQNNIHLDKRINLFNSFYDIHPRLPAEESLSILVHECDAYRVYELLDHLSTNHQDILYNLPSYLVKRIQDKLKGTTLAHKLSKYISIKK